MISTIWRGGCCAISPATAAQQHLPRDAMLVARNMGPAELLDYGREKLLGLALEDAASTSHVAIVARSMGLPLVSSLEGIADNARAGDAIVVDGETGEVHLRPPVEIVAAFEEKRGAAASRPRRVSPRSAICPPSPGTAWRSS